MIPRDYITSWRIHAPWATDAQVKQDLVVTRALVELFGVPDLALLPGDPWKGYG